MQKNKITVGMEGYTRGYRVRVIGWVGLYGTKPDDTPAGVACKIGSLLAVQKISAEIDNQQNEPILLVLPEALWTSTENI